MSQALMLNHKLQRVLAQRVAAGLKRRSIARTSDWALQYRVMGQPFPGKWTFRWRPWLRDMHDCNTEMMTGMKAAQMGYTETALNKALKAKDIDGQSVMYILPASKPDASDFSSSRFDPALEMSPHLAKLFTSVKNVQHKRAGNANLYLRGSKSRSQLKSVPAGMMIFDEVDEMNQKNIPLAFERMSGQKVMQAFMLSTPTIEGIGISKWHEQTTCEEYTFKCPCCSRMTMLESPENNLVITADDILDPEIENSYYVCKDCGGILHHEEKINWLKYETSEWVPSFAGRTSRGFHINQMYSMALGGKPAAMAKAVIKADFSPEEEQELYNSKLGMTHAVKGARVDDEHIIACTEIGGHTKIEQSPNTYFTTMGVDIGKWIHLEINQWFFDDSMMTFDINLMATSKLVLENKVRDFEELDRYMNLFNVNYCVIDAEPETRKATEFANRFYGRVSICYYARGVPKKFINEHTDTPAISVDRTSWLDASLGRIIGTRCMLPKDLSMEYKKHIKSLVRIYKKDADGNPVGSYVKESNAADHFAHAHNYAEIALPLGLGLAQSKNIEERV